jgi:thiosulfate/3-mercaptopyruvate sulfurtransferase
MLVEPAELATLSDAVVFDCRFSLPEPAAGREAYASGHIPGAHYLALDCDLSGPVGKYGGRHPLPPPAEFSAMLARFGVDRGTRVIAYDDSRFAFASRLWWMMRSLGFRPPQLLNGGYPAWLAAGGDPQIAVPEARAVTPAVVADYRGCCDFEGLRLAQGRGALVVDAREEKRYLGLEEPIDKVAGHIPGAVNRPWQAVTCESGVLRGEETLREHWSGVSAAEEIVVYCGSGVTACVNLFSLALLGREATLYAGSWSDWCSRL